MTEFCFFNTNVLLYLYDRQDAAKRMRAAEIFRQCLEAGTLVISTQVVQEFYAAATRKLHLDFPQAHDLVADLCQLRLVSIQCPHILHATEIQRRFGVSFGMGSYSRRRKRLGRVCFIQKIGRTDKTMMGSWLGILFGHRYTTICV